MYSRNSPGLTWRKSSYSQPNKSDCVEVADTGAAVGIRDSKDPSGPALSVSRADFAAFVRRVKES